MGGRGYAVISNIRSMILNSSRFTLCTRKVETQINPSFVASKIIIVNNLEFTTNFTLSLKQYFTVIQLLRLYKRVSERKIAQTCTDDDVCKQGMAYRKSIFHYGTRYSGSMLCFGGVNTCRFRTLFHTVVRFNQRIESDLVGKCDENEKNKIRTIDVFE